MATLEQIETTLWASADKLRGHLDAAEYKHVVLGLVFLKYISDAFQVRYDALADEEANDAGVDPEDRDEYTAEGVFWVPQDARWAALKAKSKDPSIGTRIDEAMLALERENPSLKDVLPKGFARPTLDKRRLGEIVDLISDVGFGGTKGGVDVLGKVYEYFLQRFASAEGKLGGEFYTPEAVVRLLVEMLAPDKGRIYDPCCGSGGMFVQSERFVEAHGGRLGDVSVYGQESNPTTWKLAKMNLAIRGIEADLGSQAADTFHRDLHPDLRADYILANPPFNISDWGAARLADDRRWTYGTPPASNANYAWVQHMLYHLAPNGVAGFVLANGSLSTMANGEGEIRKALVEQNLVDCIVSLPTQLFYTTQIPVTLWFLAKNKAGGKGLGGAALRDRRDEVLFIDARGLGEMTSRTNRTLTDADRARITQAYHAWRGDAAPGSEAYADVAGFCRAAPLAEVREHGHVLTPGRYVGTEAAAESDEPFEEAVARLAAEVRGHLDASAVLDAAVRKALTSVGA